MPQDSVTGFHPVLLCLGGIDLVQIDHQRVFDAEDSIR
jgi:hypothetical protein